MPLGAGPTEAGGSGSRGARRLRVPNGAGRKWLLVASALLCWATMRVVLAAEADSGWVTARPAPASLAEGGDHDSRIVIDHVLGRSRLPLLVTPAPGIPASDLFAPGWPRLAQQMPGIDGWRPVMRRSGGATMVEGPAAESAPSWPRRAPELHEAIGTERRIGPALSLPEAPLADATEAAEAGEESGDEAPPKAHASLEFRAPRIDSLPAIRFGGGEDGNGAPAGPSLGGSALGGSLQRTAPPSEDVTPIDEEEPRTESIADESADDGFEEGGFEGDEFDDNEFDGDESIDGAPNDEFGDEFGDEVTSDPELGHEERVEPSPLLLEETEEDENAGTAPDGTHQAVPGVTLPPKVEAKPLPPLTRPLTNLRWKVRDVLKGYYRLALNSRENDPWEVMHGMLAYELNSKIRQGSSRGPLITSVGWLCYNKPCKGLTLLYVTPEGELRAKQGVGLQGHRGQLLAMLAQCRVAPEYPIRVGKHQFTIQDLIEAEKKTCYPKTELTFKLIALTHYLDLNDTWVNDEGLDWSIPRLIREELAQPIRGAACGGTHRLSGLSLAVKARERRGEPLDGEYLRAAEYVEKYEQYAFRLQNRDGSLSTRWFQGAGDEDDIDRRVKTTGHILEWLVYSLTDEELRQARTIRAVNYLATLLQQDYDHEWEIGPRSHAIHALLRYDERVFKPYDGMPEMAGGNGTKGNSRQSRVPANRRGRR